MSKVSKVSPRAWPKTRTPTSVTRRAPRRSMCLMTMQWSAMARQKSRRAVGKIVVKFPD